MDHSRVGRSVRALRHRRAWTQAELGRRVGASDQFVSRLERGRLSAIPVARIERVLAALDASLDLRVRWRGGELDRLLDQDHGSTLERHASRLHAAGWVARAEVSFNHYDERGRIDHLGFHEATRTLLVTEAKTGIFDTQDLLGRLDVKERLARDIARRFGWMVERVAVALVVAEGRTNRRRIEQHPELFGRFSCRGRAAAVWLKDPRPLVGGLLMFENLASRRGVSVRRAGRQRVRSRARVLSVESPLRTASDPAEPA